MKVKKKKKKKKTSSKDFKNLGVSYIYLKFFFFINYNRMCQWCNGYRRRNWTDCISHSTNTLGKGMNPIILPPALGK